MDVGEAGILVSVGVTEGRAVGVVVEVGVLVTVGQVPTGMEIAPAALAHSP